MPSGLTFDAILIAIIAMLAIWEAVVAVRRKEKKRIAVIVLALIAAAVLLYLRWPQLFGSPS